MDDHRLTVETVLAELRRLAEAWITDGGSPAEARRMASMFFVLDSHLSNGGMPPEVWREGPDEPDREPSPADEEGWDAREDFLRGGHD